MSHLPERRSRTRRMVRSIVLTAVLALGATACSTDEVPEGEVSATSSVAPDPKKATTALNDGLKAHAEGDLTAAAAKYEETLRYDPVNKFAFYNLALIDAAAGNYGLAEERYRAALKVDPAYGPALFNLAILRTGRDPEEAIQLYRAAVVSDKKDAAAWLNLGLLLRASGEELEGDNGLTVGLLALGSQLKGTPTAP